MKCLTTLFSIALLGNVQGRPNVDPFIIGGDPVGPREFPGFVSIQIDGVHRCGGSILDPMWIMTIAHCMVYETPRYTVLAGTDSLTNGNGTKHNVTNIIINEDYVMEDSWKNDIAVIRVDPPISIGDVNKAVNLPVEGQTTDVAENATIVGFGSLTLGGPLSDELRKAQVYTTDRASCDVVYTKYCNLSVHDTQICGGTTGNGFCGGDTGGPLIVKDQVVGISSWSKGCAEPGFPGVFTEVSHYISWINNNIHEQPMDQENWF